jgi:predicted ATPase
MQKKIVLIGGPGTGKSSVLKQLKSSGFCCMEEISRQITIRAQEEGVEQLFLTEPISFSKLLHKGRKEQYLEASRSNNNLVFFDRGLPDIHAYLDYTKEKYPSYFKESSTKYRYDYVFIFKPWKEIFITDGERYESFKEATIIDTYLEKSYRDLNYTLIEVPFDTIKNRSNFILNWLKNNA